LEVAEFGDMRKGLRTSKMTSQKLFDFLEELIVSIIRAMSMVEAVSRCL
jgi:hypothetical protein